jgi:hypothetical protein
VRGEEEKGREEGIEGGEEVEGRNPTPYILPTCLMSEA